MYAFDADGGSSAPLWRVSLIPSEGAAATVPDRDVQCPFISPEVGITSTPVIDTETGTLYVLSRIKRWKHRFSVDYAQRLHALAVTTGIEKFGGPVEIHAAVSGVGVDSSGGQVQFNALSENPRGALLLTHGSVYLTWASSCDVAPYHGWVMAYDARTLRQRAVLNTSPDAAESGIWMSDTGPAADEEGNVYVATGNGHFDAGRNYGDSVLKLRLRGNRLAVVDQFTPSDQQELNSSDGDLGSGGPLLLPGSRAGLVFGGKAGVLYDIDARRMGGVEVESSDAAARRIKLSKGIYSAPAYWNGHLYYFTARDSLKDFVIHDGKVASPPAAQSLQRSKYSGATPTVSANGAKNGIVWLLETKDWNDRSGRAVLHAFDAQNVARELYAGQAGEALRFTIPTVANGRVYVGLKKEVAVFGLTGKLAP